MTLLPLPGLLPAAGLDHRLEVVRLTVLTHEPDLGPMPGLAEVAAVHQQTLLPTEELQREPGNRSVRDHFEGGANPPVGGVDKADQDDANLTLQVRDDVREFAFATV